MVERVYKPNMDSPLPITPKTKQRFWELDFLRGLCVILMVIDHFFYSAGNILPDYVWTWADTQFWSTLSRLSNIYWVNYAKNVAHFVVISMFFLISGISCTLSKNNAARGLKALAVALVITMVTFLADRILQMNVLILFGVIHMLAVSMLIFSLIDLLGFSFSLFLKLFCKKGADNYTQKRQRLSNIGRWIRWVLPGLVGIIGLILFFALPLGHFKVTSGYVEILDKDGSLKDVLFYYPNLFSNVAAKSSEGLNNFLSIFIKLDGHSIVSSDYFPLIPYTFLVLIGSLIGRLVYHTKAKNYLTRLDGKWNKPVSFVGRHALLVYLLHQLIIVAFFFAVGGIYMVIN